MLVNADDLRLNHPDVSECLSDIKLEGSLSERETCVALLHEAELLGLATTFEFMSKFDRNTFEGFHVDLSCHKLSQRLEASKSFLLQLARLARQVVTVLECCHKSGRAESFIDLGLAWKVNLKIVGRFNAEIQRGDTERGLDGLARLCRRVFVARELRDDELTFDVSAWKLAEVAFGKRDRCRVAKVQYLSVRKSEDVVTDGASRIQLSHIASIEGDVVRPVWWFEPTHRPFYVAMILDPARAVNGSFVTSATMWVGNIYGTAIAAS